MKNFTIIQFDDPREEQISVARWIYSIGSKVAYIKDQSSEAFNLTVRTAT